MSVTVVSLTEFVTRISLLQLVVVAVPLDGQLLLSHLRGYGGDVARR